MRKIVRKSKKIWHFRLKINFFTLTINILWKVLLHLTKSPHCVTILFSVFASIGFKSVDKWVMYALMIDIFCVKSSPRLSSTNKQLFWTKLKTLIFSLSECLDLLTNYFNRNKMHGKQVVFRFWDKICEFHKKKTFSNNNNAYFDYRGI